MGEYKGITKVAGSIKDKLGSLHSLSSERCIYKVPELLRKAKAEAYRPIAVSIGPFHYDDDQLHRMQEQKVKYLNSFLKRDTNDGCNTLEHYINFIGKHETKIRECYAEKIDLTSEKFVEMVLLDAVFIIELFLRFFEDKRDEDCSLFHKPKVLLVVSRDLLVEENQLPFFILDTLYKKLSKLPTSLVKTFRSISQEFFKCTIDQRLGIEEPKNAEVTVEEPLEQPEIKHLLDLCRLWLLPHSIIQQPNNNNSILNNNNNSNQEEETYLTKNARELKAAGVKFARSQSNPLLDIKFEKGVLQIPKLRLSIYTAVIFRNIVAFEQCHYPAEQFYFINYFTFLDHLIETSKDVEILEERGIIENWLGDSKQVANFLNSFGKYTWFCPDEFHFSTICRDLNTHAAVPWNRWKAILKRDYFSHPWSIISVVYAVLLLVLTIIQTVTSLTPQ